METRERHRIIRTFVVFTRATFCFHRYIYELKSRGRLLEGRKMKLLKRLVNHPYFRFVKWGYLAWSVIADVIVLSGVVYYFWLM